MTEPFAMEGSVTPQPLLFMFACLKGLLWRCQAVMRWVILGLTGSCNAAGRRIRMSTGCPGSSGTACYLSIGKYGG